MSEEIKTGQSQPIVADNGAEKQPEAVPTSKEQAEVTPEANNIADTTGITDELDEGVKERTKQQFEKLKAEKDALKKQLEQQKTLNQAQNYPSVLDVATPIGQPALVTPSVPNYNTPQQPVPQVSEPTDLVYKDGYINTDELTKRLKFAEDADKRARDAEARIARFEQDAETKALYTSYPELDPTSGVFNKDAYELVRNELTTQIVQSGKRDSMGAAAKMSKYFREQPVTPVTPVQPTAVQQRDQASVTDNTSRQSGESLADLKLRSRRDSGAMAERLKRLGL